MEAYAFLLPDLLFTTRGELMAFFGALTEDGMLLVSSRPISSPGCPSEGGLTPS